MKSALAALQFLVLPAGAISGQRIVLDGVNGEIDVYNVADQLIARIDTGGIETFRTSDGSMIAKMGPVGIEGIDASSNLIVLVDGNGIDILDTSGLLIVRIRPTEAITVFDTSGGVLFKVNTSGRVRFGGSANHATTATAGAQTLPANPQGFLIIEDNGGTTRKIPYYNA